MPQGRDQKHLKQVGLDVVIAEGENQEAQLSGVPQGRDQKHLKQVGLDVVIAERESGGSA